MSQHATIKDAFGPGSFVDTALIDVPTDSRRILADLVRISPQLGVTPEELDLVDFAGDELSCIPGNIKSQAYAAALNALQAILARQISALRGVDTGGIKIDTDAAGLYPGTVALGFVDGQTLDKLDNVAEFGVDLDRECMTETDLMYRTWSIYPTKDPNVWYQGIGNFNPKVWLKQHRIDPATPHKDRDEAYEIIRKMTIKHSPEELEAIDVNNGFCGQIVHTPKRWQELHYAKSLARHPLFNVEQALGSQGLPPIEFSKISGNDKRPLAGLKVLELARMIAAPELCRVLGSLGADVIKAQSPNLHDVQGISLSLTAGKRIAPLDLNKAEDAAHLKKLFDEADVIVSAFRLKSLERRGFGLLDALEAAKKRGKGIVYVDLNTYGPDGYYAERPGFQQVADAASGCTYVLGRSLGYAPGTGVAMLPVADMLSGSVGVVNVLKALRDRATKGGSYHSVVSLVATDLYQLTEECGLYSQETVDKIQAKYKFGHMGPETMVGELLAVVGKAWVQNGPHLLKKPGLWVTYESAWGQSHTIQAPMIQFENEGSSPKYNHAPVPFCSGSPREEWAVSI
ncbi:CoA-transferase family III [Aureobasidium namibiae CBS 147.97]|uniref:CoA-transferase family III n=1 Tax=Aureobasidium namibiae CBS 147.97 TaxID=1043004 RepID=A0A074W9C4_9PEZI